VSNTLHNKYRYKFDAKEIINHFGGASNMLDVLNDVGADISLKAVQKMSERDLLQSDVVACLIMAAGKKFDVRKFIVERNDYGGTAILPS
jgi:cytochrome b involved in lipid metabolism